ncbi:hypothetical protein TcWFU_003580 [Taenia crassiceps]|uniref:Uncharacterized protein n=1 Tax=Taenia crassiceps TaxID=6207 RepID=A0ABR4QAH0_9CEST
MREESPGRNWSHPLHKSRTHSAHTHDNQKGQSKDCWNPPGTRDYAPPPRLHQKCSERQKAPSTLAELPQEADLPITRSRNRSSQRRSERLSVGSKLLVVTDCLPVVLLAKVIQGDAQSSC